MINLIDYIDELNNITNKLENADTLLRSVCDNYFSWTEEKTDPLILHSHYKTFSDLTRLTSSMLWDIEKEYRNLSEKLANERL